MYEKCYVTDLLAQQFESHLTTLIYKIYAFDEKSATICLLQKLSN